MPSINELMLGIQQGNDKLAAIGNQATELGNVATQDLSKQVDLTTAITADNLKSEQAATKMGQAIGHAFGVDPGSADNRLTRLAQIKTQATDKAMGLLDQAANLEGTSFFTNPIGYIVNNFAADDLKEQADLISAKAQMATTEMQSINEQIRSGMETAKVLNKNVSDEEVAKRTELGAIAARQAAIKAQFELLDKQTDTIKAIQSGNNNLISAIHGQQTLAMEQQNHALAVANFHAGQEERAYQHAKDADAKEYRERVFAINTGMKQERLDQSAHRLKLVDDKTEQGARDRATIVANYKMAMAKVGAARGINLSDNPDEAYAQIVKWEKSPNGSPAKSKFEVIDNIASNATATGGLVTLGNTPAEVINAVGILDPEMQYSQGKVYNAFIESPYTDLTKNPEFAKLSPQQQVAAINNAAMDSWKLALKTPDHNEYTRLPKLTLMAESGAIRNTSLWKDVLKPQLDNGAVDITGDKLLKLVDEYTLASKSNINAAGLELAEIVSQALTINNLDNGQVQLGLPAQRSYPVTITVDGKPIELNLADPTDAVKAMLARRVQFRLDLHDFNIIKPLSFEINQKIAKGVSHIVGNEDLKNTLINNLANKETDSNPRASTLMKDLLTDNQRSAQERKTPAPSNRE